MSEFPPDLHSIHDRILALDPISYAKTRNYIDGGVSYLSPYISRGVISTSYVLNYLIKTRNIRWSSMVKFVQELAWRDYFQLVWKEFGDLNRDIKNPQQEVIHYQVPQGIVEGNTGIHSLDSAIKEFYTIGYLHNHMRMYIASIATNIGKSYWLQPAKWMYYHLLDADWGSNALSWQWVAGAFSNKKYYANQDNINKFTRSSQKETFLDTSYEALPRIQIPQTLADTIEFNPETLLPDQIPVHLDSTQPLLIYNFYNLDPIWRNDIKANRILLLEPSFFKEYPVSEKTIEFILKLAEEIPGIQLFIGEFEDLVKQFQGEGIYFKEHPTVSHYNGLEDDRDWMFPEITGYYPSFSKYWRQCEIILKRGTRFDSEPRLF